MKQASAAEAVALWHAEHRDFERLLRLLGREVAMFHAGGRPNYDLMMEIVEYLSHFPDHLHHVREGVAFRCLARRVPSFASTAAHLEQEHRILATAGQSLLRRLVEVQNDAVMARTELEMAAATYIAYYSMHIRREEEEVMPLAEQALAPEDWEEVAAAAPSTTDPVFGEAAGPRFRELRRLIALEPGSPPG
jgi:hemerythrin-like domain-containing protein